MRGQPERLAWFTKPEIAIKQRVREYVNEKKVEQRKLLEQVEMIHNQVNQSTKLLHAQLRSCLDVLDPAVDRIEPEENDDMTDDETPKP